MVKCIQCNLELGDHIPKHYLANKFCSEKCLTSYSGLIEDENITDGTVYRIPKEKMVQLFSGCKVCNKKIPHSYYQFGVCSDECKKIADSVMSNGVKFDQGKLRWGLLPWLSLKEVVKVYSYGAKKYAEHNWTKGISYSRVFDALQRHLQAFWCGESIDQESKLYHLAHACFGVLTLLYFEITNRKELDDRLIPHEKVKE